MSENPQPQPESTLSDEIRNLGKAIGDFLKTAWASQERQEVQRNLQESLKEVSDSLSQAAQTFEQSETGQRIKADLHDFTQRVESGEVQTKVHDEMLGALRKASAELQKVTDRMSDSSSANPSAAEKATPTDSTPPPSGTSSNPSN